MTPFDLEGHEGTLSPLAEQVSDALEGAVYPLWRREVVRIARANEAPRVLLSLLEGTAEGPYASLGEVQQAVS